MMTFTMRPEHIEEGVPGCNQACAVAVCLKEHFPQCLISADVDTINITHADGRFQSADTPADVREFMDTFDNTDDDEFPPEDLEPITFSLDLKPFAT